MNDKHFSSNLEDMNSNMYRNDIKLNGIFCKVGGFPKILIKMLDFY